MVQASLGGWLCIEPRQARMVELMVKDEMLAQALAQTGDTARAITQSRLGAPACKDNFVIELSVFQAGIDP